MGKARTFLEMTTDDRLMALHVPGVRHDPHILLSLGDHLMVTLPIGVTLDLVSRLKRALDQADYAVAPGAPPAVEGFTTVGEALAAATAVAEHLKQSGQAMSEAMGPNVVLLRPRPMP